MDCKYTFPGGFLQNKLHQVHTDFSDKEAHTLSFQWVTQQDSHILDCLHNPGELYISPQHMKLEGCLGAQLDSNKGQHGTLLCIGHFLHRWCFGMDSHILLKHKLCQVGSQHPSGTHLNIHKIKFYKICLYYNTN